VISAWRIVPEQRATTAFDGEGARLYGGRWNSSGKAVVYCAGSHALAALEVLVHLTSASRTIRYALIEICMDDRLIDQVDIAQHTAALNSPMIDPRTQRAGDEWIEHRRTPALRVASALIAEEPNYLINPYHPDFNQLEIRTARTFAFDPRLTH
jgi:RES domain-containing protein